MSWCFVFMLLVFVVVLVVTSNVGLGFDVVVLACFGFLALFFLRFVLFFTFCFL